MMIPLPADYRPSDDEEFMNPIQVEYFRLKLLRWRADLLKEADGTLASLSEGGIHEADITDPASEETERAREHPPRERLASSSPRSGSPCSASKTARMAFARKPGNRSDSNVWRPDPSQRCLSRRRNVTNAWKRCTVTIDTSPRWR